MRKLLKRCLAMMLAMTICFTTAVPTGASVVYATNEAVDAGAFNGSDDEDEDVGENQDSYDASSGQVSTTEEKKKPSTESSNGAVDAVSTETSTQQSTENTTTEEVAPPSLDGDASTFYHKDAVTWFDGAGIVDLSKLGDGTFTSKGALKKSVFQANGEDDFIRKITKLDNRKVTGGENRIVSFDKFYKNALAQANSYYGSDAKGSRQSIEDMKNDHEGRTYFTTKNRENKTLLCLEFPATKDVYETDIVITGTATATNADRTGKEKIDVKIELTKVDIQVDTNKSGWNYSNKCGYLLLNLGAEAFVPSVQMHGIKDVRMKITLTKNGQPYTGKFNYGIRDIDAGQYIGLTLDDFHKMYLTSDTDLACMKGDTYMIVGDPGDRTQTDRFDTAGSSTDQNRMCSFLIDTDGTLTIRYGTNDDNIKRETTSNETAMATFAYFGSGAMQDIDPLVLDAARIPNLQAPSKSLEAVAPNTLNGDVLSGTEVWYSIHQFIPHGMTKGAISKLTLSDYLPDYLEYAGEWQCYPGTVTNDTSVATAAFDANTNLFTVDFGSTVLNTESFYGGVDAALEGYGSNVIVKIKCRLKQDLSQILNDASDKTTYGENTYGIVNNPPNATEYTQPVADDHASGSSNPSYILFKNNARVDYTKYNQKYEAQKLDANNQPLEGEYIWYTATQQDQYVGRKEKGTAYTFTNSDVVSTSGTTFSNDVNFVIPVPKFPNPVKYVSDSDQANVTANTLKGAGEDFTYTIAQDIPAGMGTNYKTDAFIFTDQIDPCLTIKRIQVAGNNGTYYDSATGTNNGWFAVSTTNNNLVATATAAALSDANFYGNTAGNSLKVYVTVGISADINTIKNDGHIVSNSLVFENQARVQRASANNTLYGSVNGNTNIVSTNVPLPQLEDPTKLVSDESNEVNKTSNTLVKADEHVTYSIKQKLPAGMDSLYHLDALVFSDQIDTCLTVDEIKVLNGQTDITNQFTTDVTSTNFVTVTAKNEFLTSDASYGNGNGSEITVQIVTHLTGNIATVRAHGHFNADETVLSWTNIANVNRGSFYGSKNTNDVITHLNTPQLENPIKLVSDESDEVNKTSNTLVNADEYVTYSIKQKFPAGIVSLFRLDNFAFSDQIDPCLTVDEIRVLSGQTDITNQFTTNVTDANLVTVTAKDEFLMSDASYGYGNGSEITVQIVTHLTGDLATVRAHGHFNTDETSLNWTNIANVNRGSFYGSKDTNDVTTRLDTPQIEEPVKFVSDMDDLNYDGSIKKLGENKYLKKNRLASVSSPWTYTIVQKIPEHTTSFFWWESFEIVDEIDSCLEYNVKDVQVLVGDKDMTLSFDITKDSSNKLTVTATDAILQNVEFYNGRNGNEVTVKVPVVIGAKRNVDENGNPIDDSQDTRYEASLGNVTPSMISENGNMLVSLVFETDVTDFTFISPSGLRYDKDDTKHVSYAYGKTNETSWATYIIKNAETGVWKAEYTKGSNSEIKFEIKDNPEVESNGYLSDVESVITPLDGTKPAITNLNVTINTLKQHGHVVENGELPQLVFHNQGAALIDNGLKVAGTLGSHQYDTDEVETIVEVSDVTLEKTADKYEWKANETIHYTLNVYNKNRYANADMVHISDTDFPHTLLIEKDTIMITGLSDTSEDNLNIVMAENGGFDIYINNLPRGEEVTVEFDAIALEDWEDCENCANGIVIENTAQATCTLDYTIDDDTERVWVNNPHLKITKKSDKREYNVGESIRYTVDVINDHKGTLARNIVISDQLETDGTYIVPGTIALWNENGERINLDNGAIVINDDQTGFVIKTGRNLRHDGESVFEDLRSIPNNVNNRIFEGYVQEEWDAAGTKFRVTYEAKIAKEPESSNQIINIAKSSADNADEVETPNKVYLKAPVLTIDKVSDKEIYNVKDTAHYTVTVGQTREDRTARNLIIKDALQDDRAYILTDTIKVFFNDEDITDSVISIKSDEQNYYIETGKDLTVKDKIVVTYDVCFESSMQGIQLPNIASAKADNAYAEIDLDVIPYDIDKNITAVKSADPVSGMIVKRGDTITYTMEVNNTSDELLTNVLVRDLIPEHTTYVDGSAYVVNGGEDQRVDVQALNGGNYVTWVIDTIRPNHTRYVVFQVTVDEDAEDDDVIINTAEVYDPEDDVEITKDVWVSDEFVTTNTTVHPLSNWAIDTHIVPIGTPEIEIKKTSSHEEANVGDTVTYTIDVKQTVKNATTSNMIVEDHELPKGVEIQYDTILVDGVAVTEVSEVIKDGDEITMVRTEEGFQIVYPEFDSESKITFDAVIKDSDLVGKEFENSATATSDQTEPMTSTVKIKVRKPKLTIDKTSDVQKANPGDTINYTIKVNQTVENAAVTNMIVEDSNLTDGVEIDYTSIRVDGNIVPLQRDFIEDAEDIYVIITEGGFKVVYPYFDSETEITYQATVTSKDLDGKKIKNTATATSDQTDPEDDTVIIEVPEPKIKITKEADCAVAEVGDEIVWTVLVEQTNNDAIATNLVITDKDLTKGVEIDYSTIKVDGKQVAIKDTYVEDADEVYMMNTDDGFKIVCPVFKDMVKITFSSTVTDTKLQGKKIKNVATAKTDQNKTVKDTAKVKILKPGTGTPGTPGTPNTTPDDPGIVKTSDNGLWIIFGILLVGLACVGGIIFFRRKRL